MAEMVQRSFEIVPDEVFLQDEATVTAISTLSTEGDPLWDILQRRKSFVSPDGMPIEVALPFSDTKALSDYDTVMLRAGGFANGPLDRSGYVSDVLVAELTQVPVVRLFSPSQSWGGAHATDVMKGWRNADDVTKDGFSEDILKDMAGVLYEGLRDIATTETEFSLPEKVHLMGESGGSPVAMSLYEHLKDDHEVLSFAGLATPNVMARDIWLELLLRDFMHSAKPGAMKAQVSEGKLAYAALAKVRNTEGHPETALQEVVDAIKYFHNDVFGKRLVNYARNHAHAAALSRPTASRLVQPLLEAGVTTVLAVLERDPVAPADMTVAHFAQQANDPNAYTLTFGDRDHAGCLNQYAIAHIAQIATRSDSV